MKANFILINISKNKLLLLLLEFGVVLLQAYVFTIFILYLANLVFLEIKWICDCI